MYYERFTHVILKSCLLGWALSQVICFVTPCVAQEQPWDGLPLPQLGVRIQDNTPLYAPDVMVWVRMPQITEHSNVFDLRIYEDPRDLVYLGHRDLPDGGLALRHRRNKDSAMLIVTELTPQPGKLQVKTRLELDPEMAEATEITEADLPDLNICPSLIRTRGSFIQYDSFADPFPEIIDRCFIFTDEGQTFLKDTVRRKMPRISEDDPRNNPPWIQVYDGVWEPVHPPSTGHTWYNHSMTRFTLPIMGVVSLDGQHIIALADDSSDKLCQAWAPCLHHYTEWTPHDAPAGQRTQQLNIYMMPNDPDMLLQRVAEDLPEAFKLQDQRIPADM